MKKNRKFPYLGRKESAWKPVNELPFLETLPIHCFAFHRPDEVWVDVTKHSPDDSSLCQLFLEVDVIGIRRHAFEESHNGRVIGLKSLDT